MQEYDPTFNSPKRKRSQQPESPSNPSPIRLNTNLSAVVQVDDDSAASSPRTKVAHRLEGLNLEGGVSKLDLLQEFSQLDGNADLDGMVTKRIRLANGEMEIPETPQNPDIKFAPEGSEQPKSAKTSPIVFKGVNTLESSSSQLKKSYPSINRLVDSKSRGCKRMSPPPLESSPEVSILDIDNSIEGMVDRATLTWHSDEITGHHPEDPDDDGEGINGIGFKPTAAQAAARAQRRKQQLAEYRSRESKEARAKRSERRRASPTLSRDSMRAETARRVRFSGSDGDSMITIL